MSGIYIHIPYCKKKCTYCNFHFKISQKDKIELIKCLKKEIIQRKKELNKKKIKTIYFGGGTPSILKNAELEELLDIIFKHHKTINSPEITIECNPEDLNYENLSSYKKIGFNRLSIGVQSFNNNELKFMNRSHDSKLAIQSILLAKKIGFKNISIDLIYGIPNQELKDWKKNLKTMFNLNIQHFSAYILTVEKKTQLYHLIKNKKLNMLSDRKIINQFKFLELEAKKNGYIHYEISNFAKRDFYSKHNTSYWKSQNYLGIGPSAHSYFGNKRRWNVSSNKNYISKINTNNIYFQEEKLSLNNHYNEYIFTSLRTIWGVNNVIIKKRYGKKFETHFLKEIKKWKLKKYIIHNSNNYKLSLNGKIFSDTISSDLFMVS